MEDDILNAERKTNKPSLSSNFVMKDGCEFMANWFWFFELTLLFGYLKSILNFAMPVFAILACIKYLRSK